MNNGYFITLRNHCQGIQIQYSTGSFQDRYSSIYERKEMMPGICFPTTLSGWRVGEMGRGNYRSWVMCACKSLQLCPTLCDPIDTGVGCHFLLQRMKVKSESEVAQLCPTLRDPMDCSLPRLLSPRNFPGKTTGVGCHCLLQLSDNSEC